MLLSRRKFFLALAAPAVIRVADLMPVRTPLILPPKVGFEIADITWNADPSTATLRHFAIYDDTDNLIAVVPSGESFAYGKGFAVADGDSFTVDFGPRFMSLT